MSDGPVPRVQSQSQRALLRTEEGHSQGHDERNEEHERPQTRQHQQVGEEVFFTFPIKRQLTTNASTTSNSWLFVNMEALLSLHSAALKFDSLSIRTSIKIFTKKNQA